MTSRANRPHFLKPIAVSSAGFRLISHDGAVIAEVVQTAFDRATRNRGLLGRDRLDAGVALVIAPCSAVHTFGMQFAIDLIYTSRDGHVLKAIGDVAPGRMSMCLGAFAVIEMAAGAIEKSGVRVGDQIEVRSSKSEV